MGGFDLSDWWRLLTNGERGRDLKCGDWRNLSHEGLNSGMLGFSRRTVLIGWLRLSIWVRVIVGEVGQVWVYGGGWC